jgi:hypothetical protein
MGALGAGIGRDTPTWKSGIARESDRTYIWLEFRIFEEYRRLARGNTELSRVKELV